MIGRRLDVERRRRHAREQQADLYTHARGHAPSYHVHFQGSRVRKPSSMGVASGEDSEIPNLVVFA